MASALFETLTKDNRQYWGYRPGYTCEPCGLAGIWVYYGNSPVWSVCQHCNKLGNTHEEIEDISAEALAFFLLVVEG